MAENTTLYVIDLRDKFSPKLNKADSNYKRFDNSVKKGTSKSGGIGSMLSAVSPLTLGVVGFATALGAAASKVISLGSEMEQIRTSFSVMFGGVEQGNKMLDVLNEFANVTPFTNDQVIKAGKTLKAFGFTAESIAPTLKILGDVSAGTGKDLGELSVIFGQIKSAGRLMGQDLLQLINAGFNPLQIISEKTGKSVGTLKDELSKGLISFDMVQQAFVDATSKGGLFDDMMKKQSQTFGGLVSTIQGKLGALFAKSGEGLATALKPVLNWVISFIDILPKINLTSLINSFKLWWETTKQLLSPIGELFGMMGEGVSVADSLQNTVNVLAATFRAITLPLRFFINTFKAIPESIAPVIESLKGVGNIFKGIFTIDPSLISQGVNQFNKGFSKIAGGIRGAIEDEAKEFKDIFATGLKEGQKGVDLAALTNLNNLMRTSATGAAGGGASSSKSSVSGNVAGISSGGIKNVTLNINKLIEQINFQTTNGTNMTQLREMVTRIIVEASTDASRLIGA